MTFKELYEISSEIHFDLFDEVDGWVNHYTRPMFGGKSAADMLKEELDKLPLYNREKVYRFFDLL